MTIRPRAERAARDRSGTQAQLLLDTALQTKKIGEALIPTLATKADVEKGFHDLVKWVVGTAFVGMGLALTIMTFVLNNAVPKQPVPPAPAAQVIQAPVPQPIIIQIPPQPQAVAPAKAPPSPAKP